MKVICEIESKDSKASCEWSEWGIPDRVKEVLNNAPSTTLVESREEILSMATGGGRDFFEVSYDVEGKGRVVEATVAKCKNGVSINYPETYMRRRDPESMVIGDAQHTDKKRFEEIYFEDFDRFKQETFKWLESQRLVVLAHRVGGVETGFFGLLIAPDNAGFFIGGLADLQDLISFKDLPDDFKPKSVIYLAPPFRHTHFRGKQIVVHDRGNGLHEIFSYNLYPGPSAKKGIYGALLNIGEQEDWLTLHASTVQVITPYENVTTILHEGASGGGKSEMLEYPHRQADGRLLLGVNQVTGEKIKVGLRQGCTLNPVTDDMALALPRFQNNSGKLVVFDAENAWFLRLNHIAKYNTDPYLENLCIHAEMPLIFLNLEGVSGSTCLIWEHTYDEPGTPCPNPRVILPRKLVPNVVDEPVTVDYRTFGIRAPLCLKDKPTYGIFGVFHILPPALAWLWRLVAPRGDANPSITDTKGLTSEGVGSFWPFATGSEVQYANLLLNQIRDKPNTRYLLFPNQHVGAWEVSFMPQWISREYISRRGAAKFRENQLKLARCPLLGYTPTAIEVEGKDIPDGLIRVEKQSEVGVEGYDAGALILREFFKQELSKFLVPDLDPLGEKIIRCCLEEGDVSEYEKLLPMTL
ncbi:MAG: DUF4914 family protein [Candidatus Altiarchaeales archaeon]|nr:DUF4914 family protein [Candidatus Altiarchaeales archaeon]